MKEDTYGKTPRLSTLDRDTLQKTLKKRQTTQNIASLPKKSYDEEANIARLNSAYDSMMFVPVQINLG